VNQLATSGTAADDERLRDHFAALARRYEAEARKHRAMAQVMTGNISHPYAARPGWQHTQLAARAEEVAVTVRKLSAYYGDLAAGRPATPPADSARFERGEGSPEPSEAQIRELVAGARTPADHRNLEEYFNTRPFTTTAWQPVTAPWHATLGRKLPGSGNWRRSGEFFDAFVRPRTTCADPRSGSDCA
jgi:hypothetical protein